MCPVYLRSHICSPSLQPNRSHLYLSSLSRMKGGILLLFLLSVPSFSYHFGYIQARFASWVYMYPTCSIILFYNFLPPWQLDNHFANFCQVITEEYCERFFMFGQLSENMEQIELRNDFWLYHFHCTLGFDWPYFQSVRKEKCCI